MFQTWLQKGLFIQLPFWSYGGGSLGYGMTDKSLHLKKILLKSNRKTLSFSGFEIQSSCMYIRMYIYIHIHSLDQVREHLHQTSKFHGEKHGAGASKNPCVCKSMLEKQWQNPCKGLLRKYFFDNPSTTSRSFLTSFWRVKLVWGQICITLYLHIHIQTQIL